MGKEIAVELKNDVALTGNLHSVDQYLNVKLTNVKVRRAELVIIKPCNSHYFCCSYTLCEVLGGGGCRAMSYL